METFDGTKQKETYGQMMNNPYFTGEEINVDDYQVVRPEFYAHVKDPAFTLNVDKFGPNAACVRMLPDVEYVEILVSLKEKRLLLMPCDETVVTGFRWARTKDGKRQPTQKSGEFFVLTLCQMMNWNADYRHKMLGRMVLANGQVAMAFDLSHPETFPKTVNEDGKVVSSKRAIFTTGDWAGKFGPTYGESRRSLQVEKFEGYTLISIKGKKVTKKAPDTVQEEQGTT